MLFFLSFLILGFIGDVLEAPVKAVRGIGRLARGKFKEGLGDILPAAGLALGGAGVLGAGPLAGVLGKIGSGAVADVARQALSRAPGAIVDVAGDIGQAALDDPLTAAQVGLGGLGLVQGARASGQASKLREQALERERRREAELEPVRQRLLEVLQRRMPERGDVALPGTPGPFGGR